MTYRGCKRPRGAGWGIRWTLADSAGAIERNLITYPNNPLYSGRLQSPMPHNDPIIWIGSYYAVQALCFAKRTNRGIIAGNRGRVDEL